MVNPHMPPFPLYTLDTCNGFYNNLQLTTSPAFQGQPYAPDG